MLTFIFGYIIIGLIVAGFCIILPVCGETGQTLDDVIDGVSRKTEKEKGCKEPWWFHPICSILSIIMLTIVWPLKLLDVIAGILDIFSPKGRR